jgi:hypothetical protein
VTPAPHGIGNPTGTVTFFDNGTEVGTATVSTAAGATTATLTTSSLTAGTHSITVSYGGDSDYKPSAGSSPPVSQLVKAATSTTLISSANPSVAGRSVTLTAKVTPAVTGLASPPGTVIFLDRGHELGTEAVSTTAGTTTTSHTSLSGAALRKPKLSLTLTEGNGAAALKTIVIALPRGLAFATAKRRLAKGVAVKSLGAKKLEFTATVKRGKLTISLKTGEPGVRVTVASPAIAISRALARKVKHKSVKSLAVIVTVTATDRRSTAISLELGPS